MGRTAPRAAGDGEAERFVTLNIPSGFGYVFSRLGPAIEELVGTGDVKARLRTTAMMMAPIFPDDFPEPLRTEYESIREALAWVPPEPGSHHGLVESTLNAMSEDEAAELARRLFSFYVVAAEIYFSSRRHG